jgi:hypothetical protein
MSKGKEEEKDQEKAESIEKLKVITNNFSLTYENIKEDPSLNEEPLSLLSKNDI